MIFFENGPDVPDELITRHQQGKVVFFCGAGISYAAGLPGFSGLVDQIYDGLTTSKTDDEKEAYNDQNYDRALNLLEKRLPGGYQKIADKLHEILEADYEKTGACDAHQALLRLSKNDQKTLKLVTTNFDAIFDYTLKQIMPDETIKNYCAPALPLAKEGRWDGIVYVHGKLSTDQQPQNPLDLVLTSAKFGEAYLTEGWAARFVSQLFQNYTICFVGYSLSDPILVYMTDAIQTKEDIYAFASYESETKEKVSQGWKSKGVTPILYPVGAQGDHTALPKTLSAWADQYENKSTQACNIVKQYAAKDPKTLSVSEKDFVLSQMRWALTHESGEAIKVFAQMEPLPPFNWADYLIEWIYLEGNETRVERYFFDWLLRYADEIESFIWCIKQKVLFLDKLREKFRGFMGQKPSNISNLSNRMAVLWDLFALEQVYLSKRPVDYHDYLYWEEQVKKDGFTAPLRLKFQEIFTPKIEVSWSEKIGYKELSSSVGASSNEDNYELVWKFKFLYEHSSLTSLEKKLSDVDKKNLIYDINQAIKNILSFNGFLEKTLGRSKRDYWQFKVFDFYSKSRSRRDVFEQLHKIAEETCQLGKTSEERKDKLSQLFPGIIIKVQRNEKNYSPDYAEFGWGDIESSVPQNKKDIPTWLRNKAYRHKTDSNYDDNWRKMCQQRFEDCLWALQQLSHNIENVEIIWLEALFAWQDQDYVLLSWNAIIDKIKIMPDPLFEKMRLSIARWLRSASQKISEDQKDIFLSLCHRLMSFENFENAHNTDLITRSINSSIGVTTEALISYGKGVDQGKFTDPDFREIIDKLCQVNQQNYQMGRVIIFHYFINNFYEVDQAWAESIIKNHCDWEHNEQSARIFWESYISSQHYLVPLMVFAQQDFFKTIDHIGLLSNEGQDKYIFALLSAAVNQIETMNKTELQKIFARLTAEQLTQILTLLNEFCLRQGSNISQYFQEKVIPFWEDYWPKLIDKKSVSVSNQLVNLCFSVDESFPQAFQLFKDWFQPLTNEGDLTRRMVRLKETDLVEKFPEEILKLFTAIIPDKPSVVYDITSNLEKIKSVRPDLEKDRRYQSLLKYTP